MGTLFIILCNTEYYIGVCVCVACLQAGIWSSTQSNLQVEIPKEKFLLMVLWSSLSQFLLYILDQSMFYFGHILIHKTTFGTLSLFIYFFIYSKSSVKLPPAHLPKSIPATKKLQEQEEILEGFQNKTRVFLTIKMFLKKPCGIPTMSF